jgi:hypothetical protein
MEENRRRSSQQILTFDLGRAGRLTARQRSEVVAALAEVLRAAADVGAEGEATNEDA